MTDKKFLWVEAYAPATVADCILPKQIKDAFSGYVEEGEFQRLISWNEMILDVIAGAEAFQMAQVGIELFLVLFESQLGVDVKGVSGFEIFQKCGSGKVQVELGGVENLEQDQRLRSCPKMDEGLFNGFWFGQYIGNQDGRRAMP